MTAAKHKLAILIYWSYLLEVNVTGFTTHLIQTVYWQVLLMLLNSAHTTQSFLRIFL